MGIRSTNKKYFSKTTTGARTKNFFARFRTTNAKTGSDGTVSSSPSLAFSWRFCICNWWNNNNSRNGYKYHFFTSSGSFVVSSAGNIDFILVGGGGGGRSVDPAYAGGGGGAGGYIESTGHPVTATTYPVTIGSGGALNSDGGDTDAFGSSAIGGGRGGKSSGPDAIGK